MGALAKLKETRFIKELNEALDAFITVLKPENGIVENLTLEEAIKADIGDGKEYKELENKLEGIQATVSEEVAIKKAKEDAENSRQKGGREKTRVDEE